MIPFRRDPTIPSNFYCVIYDYHVKLQLYFSNQVIEISDMTAARQVVGSAPPTAITPDLRPNLFRIT